MKAPKLIDIVYFSGTGCTEKAAYALKDALCKNGVAVCLHKLIANNTFQTVSDMLIIMFPVYAANAPKPVENYINSLPAANGKKAAVMSVSAGGEMIFNTASRLRVIKMLKRKGYDVTYEEMFVMPANCISEYSDVLNAMLLRALPVKAEAFAQEIIFDMTCRKKPLLIDRLISKLMLIERYSAKSFSKNLVSGSDCISCGKCAVNCPTQNIAMKNQKPVFGSDCALCLMCIYSCPQKAITAKSGKRFLLKNGFDLQIIEEKSKYIVNTPAAEEAAKGFFIKA